MLTPIEQVLVALRRIIRATDLHSSHLAKTTGMTAPQILLLRAISEHPRASVSDIARDICLSQATVTTIINRLEKRGLVLRQRSTRDKRVVHTQLTKAGRDLLDAAPIPLQQQFANQFQRLEDWEKSLILTALQKVAGMMDAQQIEASPVLDIGDLEREKEAMPAAEKRLAEHPDYQ